MPTPTVNVTARNAQTVGQSLTLQCEVTTVRGITSRVEIVWSDNTTVLERVDNVSLTVMNNSLVYTDHYTFLQLLSTSDDDRMIQCKVLINTNTSVIEAFGNITLNVTGK